METNKLIAGIVAAAIAVIVLAGVLMPALGNATTTHETVTNDGYIRMAEIESTDEGSTTIAWDKTNPNVITVNGDDVKIDHISEISSNGLTVLFNDNWMLRAYQTDGNVSSINYVRSVTSGGATATNSIELTMSAGSMSITVDGVSGTGASYTHAMIPSSSGDFIMKLPNKTAYIFEDSRIMGFGLTNVNVPDGTKPQVGLKFDGSMDDGVTFSKWRGSTVTVSFETPVINTTSSKYIDVYNVSTVTDVVNSKLSSSEEDTTSPTEVTYSYFVVPYSLGEVELVTHASDTMIQLFNVIPLLIIVAVLLGVVAIFILRRE